MTIRLDDDGTSRTDALLTDAEHTLCAKLGSCAADFYEILGSGVLAWADMNPQHQRDYGEFVAHIHDLQHAVMARAAVRAYPERYRP